MSDWKTICRLDDIPVQGARRVRRAHGGEVAVFRTADDRVFALLDRCPHKGGPLSQGIVFGEHVACPLHNWAIGLADGTARHVVKPGLVFNRIHVDDACDAVVASLHRTRTRTADAIYLLADTLPAAPQDVLAHAAALSGLPLPPARPYDPVQASPAQRRFYGGCKRIDARGTYEALHWRPRHPDYRYGLDALWQAGEGRPPRA